GLAAVAGWFDLGLAFIRTSALAGTGALVQEDARTAFWLGLGGELRYTIGAGFSLAVGAGGAWFPVTSRFYAAPRTSSSDVPALVEGPLELRARATVIWEVP